MGMRVKEIKRRLEQAFQLVDDPISPSTHLLIGDSGTGKTFVCLKLASEFNLKVHVISLGHLAATHSGQVEKGIRHVQWHLTKKSLVLIEDIDLLFPAQSQDSHDFSLVSSLRQLVDNIPSSCLIVATSRTDGISKDIKKLFLNHIHLQIPTPQERYFILHYLISDIKDGDLSLCKPLAQRAHGFIAADLAQWYRLAEENTLVGGSEKVSLTDFNATFSDIRLSGFQGALMAEKPDSVHWSDIGGLTEAKHALEESAVWIYKHADAYKRLGIRPSKGILLYGPPGTGKTLLAKAVATESDANFLPVSIPDLIKGEVGESEKAVSRIFQTAIRCSPCVIFLDELEAIFSSREASGDVGKKLISQFLIEMDQLVKVDQSVIILGATNHPEAIDTSILRPGRLDRLVFVGTPNTAERLQILRVLAKRTNISENVDLEAIARKTDGYTGADLQAVVRKAGLLTLKNKALIQIQQDAIEYALNYVSASVP